MTRTFALSLLFSLALLAACSSTTPPCGASAGLATSCTPLPADTISGTVTAPAGVDIAGTEVWACRAFGGEATCWSAPSTVITNSGPSGTYRFSGLLDLEYAVIAYKDIDGDNIDEYVGMYSEGQQAVAVAPPANNIDVQLEPVR